MLNFLFLLFSIFVLSYKIEKVYYRFTNFGCRKRNATNSYSVFPEEL